jgi:hypothetical protein
LNLHHVRHSPQLCRAVDNWKHYLDNSPFYHQIFLDKEESVWEDLAESYDQLCYPGDQREVILSHLLPHIDPGDTAIEIGAGPGTFTCSLAKQLAKMTVVEPSPSMLRVLKKRLKDSCTDNVTIINKTWQEATPTLHDCILALGCLYAFYEIDRAVEKMFRFAKKKVVLLHLGGNGLHSFDYEVAMALKVRNIFFFPPVHLIVDLLVAMNLEFQLRNFPIFIEKHMRVPDLKRRYTKIFPENTLSDEILTSLLKKQSYWDDNELKIQESITFALIEIPIKTRRK